MAAIATRTVVEHAAGAATRERERERATSRTAGLDGWLLTVCAALCAFGLVMVYSASEVLGYRQFGNPNYFFERQLAGLAIGGTGLVFFMKFDYHHLRRFTKPITIATVVALIAVLIPHIGSARYGAQRWFSVGPISVQPSAVATVAAIVCLSKWLADRGPKMRTRQGVRDYIIVLSLLLGLIIAERDMGSTIVMGSAGFILLVLAGARKRHLIAVTAFFVGLAVVMVKMESYRSSRFASFQNPFADPLNTGFQSVQALYALGSGGFTGLGLGNSIQKYLWLPEAHTDFIFAIIGEELGLIGTISLLIAFALLLWRGIRASLRAPDSFGVLLAGGIIGWIGVQAFINIAAVTNVVPTTGIPLPLISYGGTSLAMTLWAIGILCNVSAQGHRQGVPHRAYVNSWRGDRRAPHSSARGR